MLSFLESLTYPALVIGTIIAQPAAALGAGALASGGAISFTFGFALIFITDMVMDTVWYVLGWRYGEGAVWFIRRVFRVSEATVAAVYALFRTHPALIIICSKLFGGFGMMPFILFTAGSSGIRFSQYIALNAIGEVGWTGILMVLGYFYSSTISSIENVVGKFFFLVGSLVVLSVFIYATKVIFRKFFIIAK